MTKPLDYSTRRRDALSTFDAQTLMLKSSDLGWLSTFLRIYIRVFLLASDNDETVEIGDRPKVAGIPENNIPLKERIHVRKEAELSELTAGDLPGRQDQRLDAQKAPGRAQEDPSGAVTLADFCTVRLEDEMDPPAFAKGKEHEAKEREKESEADDEEDEGDDELLDEIEGVTSAKKKSKKKRNKTEKKRKSVEDEADDADTAPLTEQLPNDPDARQPLGPLTAQRGHPRRHAPPSPTLRARPPHTDIPRPTSEPQAETRAPSWSPSPLDATLDSAFAEEVTGFLQNDQGSALAELDTFILTEDEAKMKDRFCLVAEWFDPAKEALKDDAGPTKSRKLHKTNAKLHGASTPSESIAAGAVRNLIKKRTKYNRRINYDALKSLFDGDSAGEVALSEKEEVMYTIDDKSDGEGVCVTVEESGGGLGKSAPAPRRGTDKAGKKRMEDAGADGETGRILR
ncbi:hypothetical protein DFH11DRAFT_1733231 [Phellopilus nigrolimitatus]|nr:hypothetical protein DFH11DRAFT_1733231 [Phellopilus nigrolimitatus]